MYKYFSIIIVALLLLVAPSAKAQKARKAAAAKTQPAKQESPGLALYRSMIPNTARVMFVDSVVVGKSGFLSRLPIPVELGRMGAEGELPLASYLNGWGDNRFLTEGDSTGTRLYQQLKQNDQWGEKRPVLTSENGDYQLQNYPFLCSDGTTLYFSAEGPESMGGRDLFMTRYDTDEGTWYTPQNLGLPFNSTANEYLLAIDDVDSLGWLVTDRRQHDDSLCIYTFVPTPTRRDFTEDGLTDKQLESYARILSISDTWTFGDRTAALERSKAVAQRTVSASHNRQQTSRFVLSDERIITSADQLASGKSRQLYAQLLEVRGMLRQTNESLDRKRAEYANAQTATRKRLATDIRTLERQREQQQTDIKSLSKQIRQAEQSSQ